MPPRDEWSTVGTDYMPRRLHEWSIHRDVIKQRACLINRSIRVMKRNPASEEKPKGEEIRESAR
jgi:hypothetical protein